MVNNIMSIRTEVREIEKYLRESVDTKKEMIAAISDAQAMTTNSEHHLTVFALVKNRIIRT